MNAPLLFAASSGDLEVRRAGGKVRLAGRFPYNEAAVLSDGGRSGGPPRKEKIAPGAFNFRIEAPDADIHLLVGHSFDHPLASKLTNTLRFRDTRDALLFDAEITREMQETTWVRDILATIGAGLAVGLSPGFRLPPPRAVKPEDAEEIEQEADDGTIDEDGNPRRGAIIRTVRQALLFEMSVVTRPAYQNATVELRNWNLSREEAPDAGLHRVLNRWSQFRWR